MEFTEARKAFVDGSSASSVTDCGWIGSLVIALISPPLFQRY